jgi:hypothetical protein
LMPDGTDPECQMPGSPSCLPRHITTSSSPLRWRPPSRHFWTRQCLRPGDPLRTNMGTRPIRTEAGSLGIPVVNSRIWESERADARSLSQIRGPSTNLFLGRFDWKMGRLPGVEPAQQSVHPFETMVS